MAPKGKKASKKPNESTPTASKDGSAPTPSLSAAAADSGNGSSNGTNGNEKKVTPQNANMAPKVEASKSAQASASASKSSGTKAPAADPLQSLQSLWTSLPWGAPAPAAGTANSAAAKSAEPRTGGAAAVPNGEWLSGAQSMWNDAFQGANAAVGGMVEGANAAVGGMVENANAAMASAGEAVQNIDASVLEGGLANLRDASDKLVRDVKEGVAALSEDAKKVSAEATSIGNNSNNNSINMNGSALLEGLKTSTREALEIFTDRKVEPTTSPKEIPAPWDPETLPEKERRYAGKLRERMLKLVVDAIYSRTKREVLFLSGVDIGDFNFDLDTHLPKALSVLEVDPNVRRLRAGLVPGKMKEGEFWNIYFWHVRHTRRLLTANNGTLPSDTENKEEEEELFHDKAPGSVGSTNGKDAPKTQKQKDAPSAPDAASPIGTEDAPKDWDKEIDDIFDTKA